MLVASEVYRDLEAHAVAFGDEDAAPPAARYGTCTIHKGQLTDARGRLVAELTCGLTVYVPGIIDNLGFEIGAHGNDVAAEHHDGDVMCWDEGNGHARCWFQTDDGAEAAAHYSFKASIDTRAGETGPLKGRDARTLFESRDVAYFTQRMWCH